MVNLSSRRRSKRTRRKMRRKRRGGKICFSKKCREKRNSRKQIKKDGKFKQEAEDLLYSLAYDVCPVDTNTSKKEYDECVENIVHSKRSIDIDSILQEMDVENLKNEVKTRPPGMAMRNSAPPRMVKRRPTPPGLPQNFINPIHRQDGAARRRKRKTRRRKKRAGRRKKHRKRKTRR